MRGRIRCYRDSSMSKRVARVPGARVRGAKPLGAAAVLAQNPLSKAVRRELWDAYALFVAAYRAAAEKLRAGVRDVVFPAGSFPPPMPFVG